jgi:hypothetical protein
MKHNRKGDYQLRFFSPITQKTFGKRIYFFQKELQGQINV